MSPRPTKEQQHPDLASAIKEAAFEQISEGGPPSVSLRAIARRLGITAPAIYNYFPDRDSLLAAMVVEGFASFGDALARARDGCAPCDHAARLRALADAYREWALSHAQQYRLIFGSAHLSIPHTHDTDDAPMRSFLVLVDVIADALAADGVVPEGDRRAGQAPESAAGKLALALPGYSPDAIFVALEAWAKVHGFVSLELSGHLDSLVPEAREELAHALMDRYIRTLGL